ncbi:MAG: ABC transporter permease [Anaerolineae bacterium]
MLKLWRVAVYEYRRNVLKRSFILALLSVPLMIGLNVGIGLFMESSENDGSPVGYVDHAGLLTNPIAAPVTGSREPIAFIPFQTENDVRLALESGDIQAYYVLAADYFQTKDVSLFYLKEPGGNATRQFYDFIQINLLTDKPTDRARRAVLIGENVTVRSMDGSRQVPGGGPPFGIIMPILIGFAFLFLLLMSSGYLMQAVVDEKENRTMEMLATSVSPTQLVGGKVLGIIGVSFTQLIVWTLITILGILIASSAGVDWFQDLRLDWGIILATVALAIPTYILASALMTAVGAMVTSAQESQSMGAVFFIFHLAPLYLAWAIVRTPNGILPVALSFLPFTALLTVTLRNIFATVPMWQVAVSVAVQTLCAVGALWLAGRAFRVGMLRYGKRLNFREILNWGGS